MVMQVKRDQNAYRTKASSSRGAESELKASLLPEKAHPTARVSTDSWEKFSTKQISVLPAPVETSESEPKSKVEPVAAAIITPIPDLIDLGTPIPKITYPEVIKMGATSLIDLDIANMSTFAPQIGASSPLTERTAKRLMDAMELQAKIEKERDLITRDPKMILYCEHLKSDQPMAIYAVRKDMSVFSGLSEQLRNDPVVFYEALNKDPLAFRYAGGDLRNNSEIFQRALKGDDLCLQFAGADIKSNKEMALLALKRNTNNFKYLSKNLQNDKDIVLACLERGKYDTVFKNAGPDIMNNFEFMAGLVKSSWHSEPTWKYIVKNDKWEMGQRLRASSEVVLSAMQAVRWDYELDVFESASDELKHDANFIIRLFEARYYSIERIWSHLSPDLQQNTEVKRVYKKKIFKEGHPILHDLSRWLARRSEQSQ